jgi:hypothetical protein
LLEQLATSAKQRGVLFMSILEIDEQEAGVTSVMSSVLKDELS